MLTKYIVGINWIDLLTIGIIVRMCFIGVKTGAAIELFKLFALWVATAITFHVYTTPLSDYLNAKVPALPLDVADVFVFCVLLTAVIVVIRIIRESFFLLVKIKAHNTFDKISGLMIGFLRGIWISSIALFIMIISTTEYLEISAKSSLFGSRIIPVAPQIYKRSYEDLVFKFLNGSKLNEEVFKAIER